MKLISKEEFRRFDPLLNGFFEFKVFSKERPLTKAVSRTHIWALYEDSSGNPWCSSGFQFPVDSLLVGYLITEEPWQEHLEVDMA